MTLCKHCSMTVGTFTPVCPRCRGRWPGLRRRTVRGLLLRAAIVAATVVFFALIVRMAVAR